MYILTKRSRTALACIGCKRLRCVRFNGNHALLCKSSSKHFQLLTVTFHGFIFASMLVLLGWSCLFGTDRQTRLQLCIRQKYFTQSLNLSSNSNVLQSWQKVAVSSWQRVWQHETTAGFSQVWLNLLENLHQVSLCCASRLQKLAKFLQRSKIIESVKLLLIQNKHKYALSVVM